MISMFIWMLFMTSAWAGLVDEHAFYMFTSTLEDFYYHAFGIYHGAGIALHLSGHMTCS